MIYHKGGFNNKSAFNTNTTTTKGNVAVSTIMDTSGNEIVQPAGYYYDGYPNEDPYVYDYDPYLFYDPMYWWGGFYSDGSGSRNWSGRNRHRGNHENHNGGRHGISSGAIAHGVGRMGGHMSGSMGHSGGGHH